MDIIILDEDEIMKYEDFFDLDQAENISRFYLALTEKLFPNGFGIPIFGGSRKEFG